MNSRLLPGFKLLYLISPFRNLKLSFVIKNALLVLLIGAQLNASAQNNNELLNKRLSTQFNNVTLGNALQSIGDKIGYTFVYSSSLLKSDRKITANYTDQTLELILKELLGGAATGLQIDGNQISIRTPRPGVIRGSVKTSDGKPAEFVTISIKGLRSAQVDADGQFLLRDIAPGTYEITASFVGLETQRKQVIVKPQETVAVNFVLSENGQQLKEVIVTSNKGKGYVAERSSPGIRIATPIMETPQNITVVTNEIIQDQQLLTTTDIAKNVSGVTNGIPYASASTGFSIRGTLANNNRLRNGMPISTMMGYGIVQEDMSYIENVEFIKGPAGFMLAQGEPGGMYNVLTKKPLGYHHASAGFTVGSYNLYRSAVDIGGPLSNKIFYRLNVMGQKSGTHQDFGQNNRVSIAPVVRYEINDRTSVTAEYNLDMVGLLSTNNVLPTRNQQPLARSFSIADPALGVTKLNNNYGYLNLKHRFNDDWSITAQAGAIASKWKGQDLYALNSVIDANGMLPRRLRYIEFYDRFFTSQIFLNGKVRTGAVQHTLLAGIDGGSLNTKGKHTDVNGILPINVNNPAYGLSRGIDTLIDESSLHYGYANTPGTSGIPSVTSWQAVMLQDDIKLFPWLQVTLGGRYTYYRNGSSELPKTDKVFTPRAGLLIQPFENTSVYALYDQAFLQQAGRTFSGEEFKPLTGNNIEFGIKREWFDKLLFTQVSVFSITKNNVLTSDPNNVGFSIQNGKVKSDGVEIDIIGRLNNNFNVVANYAYINARVTEDTNPQLIGQKQPTPVQTINGWLRYKVQSGTLQGLGLGLGTSYYAGRYINTIKKNPTDPQRKLPDYKSVDAAAYYAEGSFNIALNVDNIGNAYNFAANSFNGSRGANGEFYIKSLPGTNYRLSVSVKF